MNLSDFDFLLPAERIAAEPARPRDSARLLHVGQAGLADRIVRDLPQILRAGDILVVNDTRVIPAQLEGKRGGATIGITLDRPDADGTWIALARNARRLAPGDEIAFAPGFSATVVAKDATGSVRLRFSASGSEIFAALHAHAALALPPYIPRDSGPSATDSTDYQTAFATHEGAVAAPTAGLHFTPGLLTRLEQAGILTARVTLHVGAGTFLPVRTDNIADHVMHAERGEISAPTAKAINEAKGRGGRIVCVGTTSLRLLETAADDSGTIRPWQGLTDIFITPGHRFRTADLLLTNFHLPKSTLLLLVSAFAGTARIRAAYAHAIESKYRFYSYGDATLLERETSPP